MFGFSLTKLILLVLAVVIVWQGFKLLGRLEKARAEGRSPADEIARNLRRAADRMSPGAKGGPKADKDKGASRELVWDEKTGSYVPKRED